MRIQQLVTFPLRGSGSGVYADKLSQALTDKGHHVQVVCVDHYAPVKNYSVETILFSNGANQQFDVPFNFPCFTTHPASPTTTFGNLTAAQKNIFAETVDAKIKAAAARFQPDLIHVHHGWVMGSVVAETKFPYVVSLHGTEHYGFYTFPDYQPRALAAMRGARAIIALTEQDKSDAIKTYHLEPERVCVIPNGIETRFFRPMILNRHQILKRYRIPDEQRDCPIVFFASKLAPHKGVDNLLRAASIYAALPESPITLIAGDGDVRGAMELMARGLNLDRVYFIGNQSPQEMLLLYNIAAVSVLPSSMDFFPLAALEALACGTPVIASDVGGLKEIVTAGTGFLVKPGDVAGLAEKISAAIQTKLKETAKDRARSHILKHFSISEIVQRFETVYDRVLAGSWKYRLAKFTATNWTSPR